jgi:hypothetical protein
MSQDTTHTAEAINLSQIAQHPDLALRALVEVVQRQEALLKEHEARLEVHSKRIDDLRFKEKPEPQPAQRDKGKILVSLLATHRGKMPALEARQIMHMSKQSFSNLLDTLPSIESLPMKTDKRRRLLVLK